MAPLALALSLALAGTAGTAVPEGPVGPGVQSSLPPPPIQLYRVAWQRALVALRPLETGPQERGGVAVDPQRRLAFVGTRDGVLHAFRADGSVLWELQGGGGFGPPLVEGDTVYAGSSDGRLYAVAIPTGKPRWTYDAREDLSTRPALAGGLVLVQSLQDSVFAVDAASGAWRWHHRREQKGEKLTIQGAASVQVGGGSAYAGYADGFVAALDARTGAARWERKVGPNGTYVDVDSIALDGDRLYATAYSGAVLALEARSGKELWTHAAPGASRVALAAGLVVAVSSAAVAGLSPTTGAVVWTTPLEGSPGASPSLAGKWLLVAAGGGGLRWLEPSTGRPLRTFDPGTGVLAAPAFDPGTGTGGGARGGGARVYVLSNGGDLFALDLG